MKKRMVGEFWEVFPGVRQQLQAQNAAGKDSDVVESELLEFVNQYFKTREDVLLAGNSIHQDRRFIENEWPRLNQRLHYRMLDVTSFKLAAESKYGIFFEKQNAHRALDDIRESIAELQHYLKFFKKP